MPLIFTYGPDTVQGRMFDRIGPSEFIGSAIVDGFSLVFNKPNMKNKMEGLPNLVPEEGKSTFGVVFDLTRKQLELFEGFFGGYERKDIKVTMHEGLKKNAVALLARRTKSGLLPTKNTITLTRRGMEENGATPVFLEELKGFEVLE